MLKIFVCHFLTKLHPFSTYEGGKSKKVFLGLPIGHPPPRRDRNRSASPIYSFLTWKQLEEANTRHLLDLGPGWYIDLLWIAKHTFCWGYLIFWSRTFAKGIYLNFQRKISNKVQAKCILCSGSIWIKPYGFNPPPPVYGKYPKFYVFCFVHHSLISFDIKGCYTWIRIHNSY